jgi:hypothetical protein
MSVQIDGSTGNIIATKADYSGNVSIGGTLTYEDVTNIDSVGLITARNGIKVDDLGVQVGTGATVDSAAANTLTFLTGGSERVRIDSSGRFGLGTSSPSQKLHIQDSSGPLLTFDDATTQFGHIGSYNKLVGSGDVDTFLISSANSKPLVLRAPTGQTISFDIASSEALRITSGGKVKIANHGTNDLRTLSVLGPQTQIQFGTAEDVGGFLLSTNNGQFGLSGGGYYNGSNWVAKHTASAQIRTDGDGAIAFFGQSGLTSGNTFTPSERLRIDSSGRVLIGTTTEGAANEADNLTIADSDDVGITLRSTNSGFNRLYFSDATSGNAEYAGYLLYKHADNSMIFGTNSTERMRIDSSGNFGIGMSTINQTSSGRTVLGLNGSTSSLLNFNHGNTLSAFIYCDSGEARLEAEGSRYVNFRTGGVERLRIASGGDATLRSDSYGLGVRSIAGSSSVNTALFVAHSSGSISTGSITLELYTNGNIKNSNNSYGVLSDERLKENIVDASSQWEDIKSLRIRKYNFRDNNGYETHTQIGLVAQETESVCPGLIQETPVREDATPVLDADGNALETTKSVSTSILYMKAVKALQEAMSRIETLESEVAALKG